MKAIVYDRYGSPNHLKLKEVSKPWPGDREVLIKVHAASVNSWDWDLLRGRPFVVRLDGGFWRPKQRILGADVSGKVVAVGKNVEHFKVGDTVVGDLCNSGWGCFAEYTCADEQALVHKPEELSFEEAAATPQAAVMAFQSLYDKRPIKAGERVLINGAGGGVGTFAIQMAKLAGATVTAVDIGFKSDLMLSLGADEVLDYTKVDFTRTGEQYDRIIDVTSRHSVFDYRRVLRPNGIAVVIGGSIPGLLKNLLLQKTFPNRDNKEFSILVHKANKDLDGILEMLVTKKIRAVIDSSYYLDEAPNAIRLIGEGKVMGKVIIVPRSGDQAT